MTTEENIIKILQKSSGMRIQDMSKALHVSRQMVHRAVKNLTEKGVVCKLGTPPRTRYRLTNTKKPFADPRIFWDTDVDRLEYDRHARAIIERVFERGDVDDIRNCRRYYGDERVTESLLTAKFLSMHTMYLASAVMRRPLKDFRCYILRQSNPTLFPY